MTTRPHTFGRRGTGTPQKIRIVAAAPVARPRAPVSIATVVPDGRIIRKEKVSAWSAALKACGTSLGANFAKLQVAAAASIERRKAAADERRKLKALAAEERAAQAEAALANELLKDVETDRSDAAADNAAASRDAGPADDTDLSASQEPHWAQTVRTALSAKFLRPSQSEPESSFFLPSSRAIEEILSYDAPAPRALAAVPAYEMASVAPGTRAAEQVQPLPRIVMVDAVEPETHRATEAPPAHVADGPAHEQPERSDPSHESDVAVPAGNKTDGTEDASQPPVATDLVGADSQVDELSFDVDADDLTDVAFDDTQADAEAVDGEIEDVPAAEPATQSNDWIWGRAYFLACGIAFPAAFILAKFAGGADNAIAQLDLIPLIAVLALSPVLGFVAFLPAAASNWLLGRLRLPRGLRAVLTGGLLGSSWMLLSMWDGKTPSAGTYGFIIAGLLGGVIFWRAYAQPTPSADALEEHVSASE